MMRRFVTAALAALAVGSCLAAVPAGARAGADSPAGVRLAYGQSMHLGPFATIRRANEVAAYYRSLGYGASMPYHNGDGYYVDVYEP